MKPALSTRQAQVAELVADDCSDKVIANRLGLSIETVRVHIAAAAAKLPGGDRRRHKLMLWVLQTSEPDT